MRPLDRRRKVADLEPTAEQQIRMAALRAATMVLAPATERSGSPPFAYIVLELASRFERWIKVGNS